MAPFISAPQTAPVGNRILRVTQTTPGTTFSDVLQDHPSSWMTAALAGRGVIAGYGDGRFGPSDPVTCAHRSKTRNIALLGVHTPQIEATSATFPGRAVGGSDPYPFDFIEEAAARGWVLGFWDGTFRPYNNVTRAQVALMVARAGRLSPPPSSFQTPFTDVPSFAAEAVRTLYFHGLVAGKTATTFNLLLTGYPGPGRSDRVQLVPRVGLVEGNVYCIQADLPGVEHRL